MQDIRSSVSPTLITIRSQLTVSCHGGTADQQPHRRFRDSILLRLINSRLVHGSLGGTNRSPCPQKGHIRHITVMFFGILFPHLNESINGGTRSHRPPCTGLPEQALTTVKEELGSGGVLFIHSVDNIVSGEDGTCERGEEGEYSERSKFHGKK